MIITQTAYSLDPLGNWKNKTTDMVTQTRTHSPSNEITKINLTPILSDNNGNTNDDGTNLYSYDEENRLVKVTAKSGTAVLGQYQYDAVSRRVSRTDNFGTQTLYYYDDRRAIEEQSSAGITQATYTFGNYIDEALTMDRVGEPGPFYYHQNTAWSLYALSDSTGKGVEGYSYDAYGYQTIVLPGPDGILWTSDDVILPGGKSSYGNPFLYTEQHLDPEAGLYYYRARYHDPMTGRFMQRDRLGYADGMNLYEYVKDSPPNYADWQGNQSFTVALGSTKCAFGEPATAGLGRGAFVVEINHEQCDKHCTEAHEATHVADELPCCEKAREAYGRAGTPRERNDVIGKWNRYGTANRNYTECRAHTCGAQCLLQLQERRGCSDCLDRSRSDDPAVSAQGREDYECCRYLLGGIVVQRGGRIRANEERRRDYCSAADANVEPPCPFEEPPPMRAPDARGEAKRGVGCFVGTSKPRGNGNVPPGEAKP
jgi:RHS repeat-associated protein